MSKASELFGSFGNAFSKTWASSGGELLPATSVLMANAGAGAAMGLAHNAYVNGDWHNMFTADGLESGLVGAAMHVAGHWTWTNRNALKQSLFTASKNTKDKANDLFGTPTNGKYKSKTGIKSFTFE